MQSSKVLSIALVALVGLSCVYSSSIPLGGQDSTQQQQQQINPAINQQASVSQVTSKEGNEKVNNSGKSTARYFGGVGGYEQVPLALPYIEPVQPYAAAPSYQAPIQQSYAPPVQSYAPPMPSYSPPMPSYSPPLPSYAPALPSYSPPIQSYEQPIVQTYQQPIVQSYSAPIVSNYSAPAYSPPVYSPPIQSYSPPVQSYSAPIVSNYSAPSYSTPSYSAQTYSAPVVSSYQSSSYSAPIVSNYSAPSYSPPVYSPPVQSYAAPVQSYSAPVQSYSAPVQSYAAPVQSYSAPVQSYAAPVQSYSAPVQSYSAPIVSNYSAPSYTPPIYSPPVYSPPVQSYAAPVQAYEQPIVQNYTQSYAAPAYEAPIQQSYQAPIQQSYAAPVQSYQQPSYAAPVQQSYQAPIQQSYAAPVQSYQAPIQQSYQAPIQSYAAPIQQSYAAPIQQSYAAPLVQSYAAPIQSYQAPIQQSYAAPIQTYGQGTIVKRQLSDQSLGNCTHNSSLSSDGGSSSPLQIPLGAPIATTPAAAALPNDEMTTSDSIATATIVAPPAIATVSQQKTYVAQPQVYQQQIVKQQLQYLDTQPEFTQSWADFYQPPGFLPIAFKNTYLPYAQQYSKYPSAGQPISLQSLGLGYVTWSGPINPASIYLPVQVPFYYRIPPASPFYQLKPAVLYQKPLQLIPTYKGIAKRSMSAHEAAPYQLLVDHLAAASEGKEVFTNVSTIECPTKPSDYTCPQMLNLSKEELKKKLCEYESVLTGSISFVPDTEKAQTRCGALKVIKQDAKNVDDISELPEKLAFVVGKECPIKPIVDAQNNNEQTFVLVKTNVPSGTKFVLAHGSNIDFLNTQVFAKDELATLMQQCPKKSQ